MHKKPITMLVLITTLLCLFASTAFAATSTSTTTASIAFEEGDLEFIEEDLPSGMNNMDIDFGSHPLPIGDESYEADDGDHTLRILDGRSNAGSWNVTVSLSAFELFGNPSNTFVGTITLSNGAVSSTTNDPSGLTLGSSAILINASSAPVVSAGTGLNRGYFDTTWLQADVVLDILAAQSSLVTVGGDYTATMAWTLQTV